MLDFRFPLSFKLIDRYQQEYPFLTKKLKCAKYKKGSFHGGQSNIELVTHEDKIVIPQKLQKYVVKWYHSYILNPGMDQTEAMISQHFYWPGIIEDVQKEFIVCDMCQRTK